MQMWASHGIFSLMLPNPEWRQLPTVPKPKLGPMMASSNDPVGDLPLEVFQSHLDMVLDTCSGCPCLNRDGTRSTWMSLSVLAILWFCNQ